MYSFSFPNMLNSTTASLVSDKQAIRQNIINLLSCERGTFFGDPFYGCRLKRFIFEQSTSIVPDLLIDEIYTAIISFIPQVFLNRKDITVYTVKTTVYIDIKYYYLVDNTSDLFTIKLNEQSKEETI